MRLTFALILAVTALTAFAVAAFAEDEEWEDRGYASRLSAAEPKSAPYLGPPIGGVYVPSEVIFPQQDIQVRFFHDRHIKGGIGCDACHGNAYESELAADSLLPPMEDCLGCHVLEDGIDATPAADCSSCHLSYANEAAEFDDDVEEVTEENFREVNNPPALSAIPTAQLIFPHKDHVDAKIECEACHGDLAEVELATRFNLPTMDMCLSCHTGGSEPSDECSTCHLAKPDGTLITNLPTGVLIPTGRFRADDHRFDYLEKHRKTTASDAAYCESCHTQAWCEDCHNGDTKPIAIHPPNYAQLHAMDAYSDQSDCESCHTTQDFCLTCHTQVGLTINEAAAGGFAFHPSGWVLPLALGGGPQSEHARAAQRNMGACVSCHQEADCLPCHSAQDGLGVQGAPINPHPANWLDTCGAAMDRNVTPCLKCHGPADPMLNMCR